MTAKKPVLVLLDAIMSLLHESVNFFVIQLVDHRILRFSNYFFSELDFICWLYLTLVLSRVRLNVHYSLSFLSCQDPLYRNKIDVILALLLFYATIFDCGIFGFLNFLCLQVYNFLLILLN